MDVGSPYEDNPVGAVEAASVALERATQAAQHMSQAIADAQQAIDAAAYGGPDPGEPDDEL